MVRLDKRMTPRLDLDLAVNTAVLAAVGDDVSSAVVMGVEDNSIPRAATLVDGAVAAAIDDALNELTR